MLAPLSAAMAERLLSPSARVLVAAAQPGEVDAAALPWADVHWPSLVSLMAYERAEVPVARLLRRSGAQLPDEVRGVVQGLERVARFRAAEWSDAAAGAVDALQAAGVPALWLKGAALAMQSAEGFAVRAMGDLDVLVVPEQVARAREALRTAGWASPPGAHYEHHHHEAPLVRPGGLRLELHTALFPPPHPFTEEFADRWMQRAVEVQWGERRVRVLSRPWHLVHAATHWAWSHEGTVGTWQFLHDMHRLTSGWSVDGEDWESVIRHADELGSLVPVGWGVWTAQRLGGVGVSDRVVNRLRGRLRVLDGMVERQWVLAAFQSPSGSPSVRWSRFWWRRAMQGLGASGERWPWQAGRGAELPGGTGGGSPASARVERWRRHLWRLLRS